VPPKKKAITPHNEGKHSVSVYEYKSTMMNTTLYEPVCTCGWSSPRYMTKALAQGIAENHANNPDL